MASGGAELSSDAAAPEPLAPGESVLLCASALSGHADQACLEILPDPKEMALLGVSLSGGPDAVLNPWRRYAASLPAKTAVVTTDEATRSAAATANGEEPMKLPGSQVVVTTVSGPSDLTGLGIKTSQCLESWAGGEKRPVVRFDSLTTLLQYAEVQRVFQFLHVLVRRIERANAFGVFHMDANAHDEQTLATIKTLFDAVHEVPADSA